MKWSMNVFAAMKLLVQIVGFERLIRSLLFMGVACSHISLNLHLLALILIRAVLDLGKYVT